MRRPDCPKHSSLHAAHGRIVQAWAVPGTCAQSFRRRVGVFHFFTMRRAASPRYRMPHTASDFARGRGILDSIRLRDRAIANRSDGLKRTATDSAGNRLQRAAALGPATTPRSCRRPISLELSPSTSASISSVFSPSSGARLTGKRGTFEKYSGEPGIR